MSKVHVFWKPAESIVRVSQLLDRCFAFYFGMFYSWPSSSILFDRALCKEKRDRRINLSLLINLLVCDGWKDGIYPTSIRPEMENPPENGFLFSAICFVLIHIVRDIAAMQENTPATINTKNVLFAGEVSVM